MSDTNSNPEPKKTPLQLVKERQAAQAKNRSAKDKRMPSSDDDQVAGAAPTMKKMRSSASKQGG